MSRGQDSLYNPYNDGVSYLSRYCQKNIEEFKDSRKRKEDIRNLFTSTGSRFFRDFNEFLKTEGTGL